MSDPELIRIELLTKIDIHKIERSFFLDDAYINIDIIKDIITNIISVFKSLDGLLQNILFLTIPDEVFPKKTPAEIVFG